jgi:hypothetical protein
MKIPIEGGCLCGGVRYRLHEQPKQLSDCHCIDCRRASAAPFVTWGAFRKEKIELLSGELRKVRHADRLRSFASCCGTPLFFQDDEESEWIDVTISSLDRPGIYSPEVAIWTEDRLPWVPLDPARPAYRQGRGSEQSEATPNAQRPSQLSSFNLINQEPRK